MMPVKKNNWLPGIFNDFFGNEWLERQTSAAPAVNIMENDREYKIEIAAPGMTRDDFKIELEDDNHLVISMEKQTRRTYGGDPEANMDENTGSSALEQDGQKNDDQQQEPQQEQQGEEQPGRQQGEEKGQQQNREVARNAGGQDRLQETGDKYLRREFSYSSFRQSMILPDNVNRENIQARVSDGVLTIIIPKTTEEEKRQRAKMIEIK